MTSRIADDSEDNPYEFHEESLGDSSVVDFMQNPERHIPPVEKSFWFGLIAIGFLGFMGFCLMSTVTVFDRFPVFSAVLQAVCMFSLSICFFIPFALIRLVIQRWNIARAIDLGTYPGTQRFGIWYLLFSIFVSWLCCICGALLFTGVCTMIFLLKPEPLRGPDLKDLVLIGVDGVLSLLLAGFLFKLGIPTYR